MGWTIRKTKKLRYVSCLNDFKQFNFLNYSSFQQGEYIAGFRLVLPEDVIGKIMLVYLVETT